MSRKVSPVVQGIIREPRSLAPKLGEYSPKASRCPDEIPALALERDGDLHQRGFLAGDTQILKIGTSFGKPAV
jgi:hypothetical protein